MKFFGNLLLVLIVLTSMVACDKAKDEEKQIIGTWVHLNAANADLLSFDEYHEYVCYNYFCCETDADSGIYEIFPENNTIILYPSSSDSKPRKIKYEKLNSDSLVVQLNWYDHTYTETYLKMSANRYLPRMIWPVDSVATNDDVVVETVAVPDSVETDTVIDINGDIFRVRTTLP